MRDLEKLEELPMQEKLSPAFQFGRRIVRPLCPCCGGAAGIKKARHHNPKHGFHDAKYKNKRFVKNKAMEA